MSIYRISSTVFLLLQTAGKAIHLSVIWPAERPVLPWPNFVFLRKNAFGKQATDAT